MLKGQFQEMLAFVILAVMITIFLVFSTLVSVEPQEGTIRTQNDLHEREDLASGASAVMASTYKDSGRSMMELAGIAAFSGNRTIDFGPVLGKADVNEEFTKRMDALYGKGKWRLEIPFPQEFADIEVAVVADTSQSMCDDITNIKNGLPNIVNELKAKGRAVRITVYLLPASGKSTCQDKDGAKVLDDCISLGFANTKELNCYPITIPETSCRIPGEYFRTSESWERGGECAAKYGPIGGWSNKSAKVVIPLSDELPSSSDCADDGTIGSCNINQCSYQPDVDKFVKAAKDNGVNIFPLQADSCGYASIIAPTTCACGKTELPKLMQSIAAQTGGQYNSLNDTGSAADTIATIIGSVGTTRKFAIEAGSALPRLGESKIYAHEMTIPVAVIGTYVKAYFYKWN